MSELTVSRPMPNPVAQRLPRYLICVRELIEEGVEWVSSQELAEALGLTASTVRQDLSHLHLRGVSKRGYEASQLEGVISQELGADRVQRLVIVGAGYLGTALALHGDLLRQGFETCAIFDADPKVVGTAVGLLTVRPMTELRRVVSRRRATLGVIAVPATAAQEVADQLVGAGIVGILNLAYVHIRVPEMVQVVDARLLASLQELAHATRQAQPTRGTAA